jgi:hypothetical protein
MSELPTIDPLKVAQRTAQKRLEELTQSKFNETQLEVLAEALRDERDEAVGKVAELTAKLEAAGSQVEDITSLPKK